MLIKIGRLRLRPFLRLRSILHPPPCLLQWASSRPSVWENFNHPPGTDTTCQPPGPLERGGLTAASATAAAAAAAGWGTGARTPAEELAGSPAAGGWETGAGAPAEEADAWPSCLQSSRP